MTIYRDQLEAVYALIEKPERWTQGTYARDENGSRPASHSWPTSYEVATDPRACRWCLAGAAIKTGIIEQDSKDGGSIKLAQTLGLKKGEMICEWNDSHTHAEVLALLKAAIERAPVRLERPDTGSAT